MGEVDDSAAVVGSSVPEEMAHSMWPKVVPVFLRTGSQCVCMYVLTKGSLEAYCIFTMAGLTCSSVDLSGC